MSQKVDLTKAPFALNFETLPFSYSDFLDKNIAKWIFIVSMFTLFSGYPNILL